MNAIVFAYHDMGVIGLTALQRHGIDLDLVFTYENDPDENCWFASVQTWCDDRQVPCLAPAGVNEPFWIDKIQHRKPDFIFSFYYRDLLCDPIINAAKGGALNLHGSLLPKYRGRAPVNWAILQGEQETGVTLHYMVAQPDAGDIVAQRAVPIEPRDTALEVYGKLGNAATLLLDEALPRLLNGTAPRRVQDPNAATTFPRRRPEDGVIDWSWETERIFNLIRAVTAPYPGAFTRVHGEKLVIWWGRIVHGAEVPSSTLVIQRDHVMIGTAHGAIQLASVNWRGRKIEDAEIAQALRKFNGLELT